MSTQPVRYYLFIDESGDHGLVRLNPDFPVFLLCGVLTSEENYFIVRDELNAIKMQFWNGKEVIFHSRDIRKCEKEFQVLFDLELKKSFYEALNGVIQNGQYTIIASAIRKDRYIERFGRLSNDVYELALSFIIERAVFWLDDILDTEKSLHIVIERRGKREDKKLEEHFQRLVSRGTGYVSGERLQGLKTKIHFRLKRENVNGLQLADLVAYPVARYAINPNMANPAFNLISGKIYTKNGRQYGLKIFP